MSRQMAPEPYILPDGTVGDLGHCRACPADIVWIITKNGKRAPINKDGTSHFGTCPNARRFRKGVPPIDDTGIRDRSRQI